MLKIAPHRYQSSSGALQTLGEYLEPLGERALVVANKTALERFEDVIRSSLKESMIGVSFEICLGECCLPEVERLSEEAEKEDADMIVGVGAGKTLDVAKYTAQHTESRMITIPSAASSNAAFTNLVYLYNDDGDFLEVEELETAPDLTLVDYKVNGLAPSRHLRAGMGVALATSYDFDLSRDQLDRHQPSNMAFKLAQNLSESLFEIGQQALEDVKKGEVTGRVESVIEMNILQAGLISSLGGISFRSKFAHCLTNQLNPYTQEDVLYGEVIAFALIVQQFMRDKQPQEFTNLLRYYRDVGLPLTMDSIGLPEHQRDSILEDAFEDIVENLADFKLPFEMTVEQLADSTKKADDLGKKIIQSGIESIQ
ncbi:MAG: iron-containing alcohol dehydrogenase [bacterium]